MNKVENGSIKGMERPVQPEGQRTWAHREKDPMRFTCELGMNSGFHRWRIYSLLRDDRQLRPRFGPLCQIFNQSRVVDLAIDPHVIVHTLSPSDSRWSDLAKRPGL